MIVLKDFRIIYLRTCYKTLDAIMAFIDYYEILGVNRNATAKEVKTNFRKLAYELHPDRNSNSEEGVEKFQKLNEAYSVISDPEKRKNYDLFGEFWRIAEQLEKKQKQDISSPVSRRSFFKKFFTL